MESIMLVICLLISGSVAIDFTTIGQKEIVDYIKNRADLIYGKKLSERNLQDLLSNAVFTGLEEEALIFAYGSSVDDSDLNIDQFSSQLTVLSSLGSSKLVPLQIILTSDTLGTTNIASSGLTTTKSSSSKSSVGDFVVNCVQEQSFDSTSLDGSITINLGGATDSHNLTLPKTIYLAAEVNVTSLGSDWEPSASQLTSEGKLLSMLSSKEGSLYVVTYQSLIRETIKTNEGDLFGGIKSDGKVLVVVGADGVISLSGRTISGKIESTWESEAEEHVDTFLTLNGSKSRKFMMSEMPKPVSKTIVQDWIYNVLNKKPTSNTIRRKSTGSSKSRQSSSWKPSSLDGSTWPSWKSFWDFGYNYRFGWESWDDFWGDDDDYDDDWKPHRHSSSTTRKPEKTTKKPKVTTTPKPAKIVKPVATTTTKPEIVTTVPTVHQEATTKISIQTTPVQESTPKPDLSEPTLPNLPKGTTISLWSTRII